MIRLRPAGPADCDVVLVWANDPHTRAASFTSREIQPEEHGVWYAASLGGSQRRLFIMERDGRAAGLLRLQLQTPPDGSAEVGINLAPEQRGRGLGVQTLHAGALAAAGLSLRLLVAHIRPDNAASRLTFERAGYSFVAPATVSGQPALRYELRLPQADPAPSTGAP